MSPKAMLQSFGSNLLNFFIVFAIVFATVLGVALSVFYGKGINKKAVYISVERGATLHSFSQKLSAKKIIGSEMLFQMGATYTGRTHKLKFGHYLIPAYSSMDHILDIVTRGSGSVYQYYATYVIGIHGSELRVGERDPDSGGNIEILRQSMEAPRAEFLQNLLDQEVPVLFRVVVAEGVTSWQIFDAVKAADFMIGALSEVSDEGRLAPGSYDISLGQERTALIEEMEARQRNILAEAWAERQADLPVKTPYEALILASLIEKETSLADEREEIAAVFVNRLNKGMRLQSDPTVIYGITQGKRVLGRGLRKSELKQETPWNTYRIAGLPVTPIGNPGAASIEAALNPEESDNLFFVADGTGGHAFSKTLDEHNRHVRKWRKLQN